MRWVERDRFVSTSHQTLATNGVATWASTSRSFFNKDAVMVALRATTCTGLAAASAELQMAVHDIVGVGDVEHHHAFLRASRTQSHAGQRAAFANEIR